MQFTLIDRIVELQEDVRIRAIKGLSLAEDYLEDHFPQFPVMPGVLMLEAMFEASAWLVRRSEDFAHSMVVLKEARNIKYADFVQPGRQLHIEADIVKADERTSTLKAKGLVDGRVAVQARLVLERFNLAGDRNGGDQDKDGNRDRYLSQKAKEKFDILYRPAETAT